MNKNMFLFLVFIIGGFLITTGQTPEENLDELLNGQIFQVDNLLYSNLSFIQQTGDQNSITTLQEQQGRISNFVSAEQQGAANAGYVEQVGSAHTTVLLQNGSGNEANIWSVGDYTVTLINQQGYDNTINSYIDNQGFLPKAVLLQQYGNYNHIDFALLGNGCLWNSWPQAAYIKQTGNNLEATAVFDWYISPVYIEQQSGAGGGMSVNVSTTAFSFPMKRF
jgi:minor curlin subunit